MNPKEYMDVVKKTWAPDEGVDPFLYGILGLAGEAGEVANLGAKCMRGDFPSSDFEQDWARRKQLEGELGGVLWYLTALCWKMGIDLEWLMEENAATLLARLKFGTIRGDGDDR